MVLRACIANSFIGPCGWKVYVLFVHLLCGIICCAPCAWCDMLVTSFTRVDCCPVPQSPKYRERAAGTSRAVCVFVYVYLQVGGFVDMKFGANSNAASC